MFRHNLILIYRHFAQHKTIFLINLVGLSTALACTLLIYIWVSDELSFDKFHKNDRQLFEIMQRKQVADGVSVDGKTSGLVAEMLVEKMPEVQFATPSLDEGDFSIPTALGQKVKAQGRLVGKDFFNIFSYELIQGSKSQVLKDKNSIVISESLALRVFNTTQNVVGSTLDLEWPKYKVIVSGIFKDVPSNSSEQFDLLLSFDKFKETYTYVQDWGNDGTPTFLTLREGVDISKFNQRITAELRRKTGDENLSIFLRPYSDRYLFNKYENGLLAGGRIEYVNLFSIVALFILVIACINFMNLSTASALRRMKEVGIKKVVGANKRTLIMQFLVESTFMTLLSLLIAVLIVSALMPYFNQLTGKQLNLIFTLNSVLVVIGITLFTGILSGSYPALYLSHFKPSFIFKGTMDHGIGGTLIRKALVVFQFAVSIILIVSVLVVYYQLDYVQNTNLGYRSDNILYFNSEGQIGQRRDDFISEVTQIQGVEDASSIWGSLLDCDVCTTGDVSWEGEKENSNVRFDILRVNYGMIEMLDIKLKEGRSFLKTSGNDQTKIIFNDAAIKMMGIKNPLGKFITHDGRRMEIIGVVKNFHFKSFHEHIKPLFIELQPDRTNVIMVKLKAGFQRKTISDLNRIYKKYSPGTAFDYKFLSNTYENLYLTEKRVAILSNFFAAIALIISCLGLFGLAAFTAERRRKEISIRKILGSGSFRIMQLLWGEFTTLILASMLFALPISYILANEWLNGFAYRIDLNWWYFSVAGLSALVIAWITVVSQAIKTSQANPIKNLRVE